MLFLFCSWAVLLAAARLVGSAVLILTSSGENLDRGCDRFFAQAWIGLVSLGSLLLAVSTLGPISPAISLGLLTTVLALGLFARVRKDVGRTSLAGTKRIAFAIVLLGVAWDAAGPVQLYDTGFYHYQVVRWLHQFGTVPGMGLLYYRLSFSSSWFALTAALDFGPWQGRAVAVANSLALAIAILHLAIAASRVLARTARKSDAYAAGALPVVIFVCVVYRFEISPSPNLAVALGAVMSGWAMLAIRKGHQQDWNLPLLLSAGAASVKIFALPLFAAIWMLRMAAGCRSRLALPLLASAALILPLPLANRISSGCPLYPSPIACAATPSSVTPAKANDVLFETTNYARYDGAYPPTASFFDGIWVRKYIRNPLDILFAAVPVLAVTAALVFGAVNGVFIAGAVAFTAMFIEAPSIRFLAGSVGMLSGSLVTTLYRRLVPKGAPDFRTTSRIFPAMAILGCAILLREGALNERNYVAVSHIPFRRVTLGRLLMPEPIQGAPEHWSTHRTADIEYAVPDADVRCWGLPVCTPVPPPVDLGYCKPSAGIRGGFCLSSRSAK